MKIWIHVNGVQEGPYELDSLPMERITPSTPVWYDGLPDWMQAGQAPLTASLFAGAPQAQQPEQTEPQQQAWTQPQQQAWTQPQQQAWQPQQQAWQQQPGQQQPVPEKCPPTFFVWSIILTVLCCNPIGIIPIITGVITQNKFRNRDYQGAQKMSTATEWWIMITIVTSLILLPFSGLVQQAFS